MFMTLDNILKISQKQSKSKPVKFEDSNVLTVEPGCYIKPNSDVPKEFWGIGIRIEDDVLVTS